MGELRAHDPAQQTRTALAILIAGCTAALILLPVGVDFIASAALVVAAVLFNGLDRALPPMPAGRVGTLLWFAVAGILALSGAVVLWR